jgi:hypothetical protein
MKDQLKRCGTILTCWQFQRTAIVPLVNGIEAFPILQALAAGQELV